MCSLLSCNSETINEKHTVEVVGEMRNVMWKGELEGIISIDSLKDYPHLYGLGPLEYLKGEILIIDGIHFTKIFTTLYKVVKQGRFLLSMG